MKVISIVGTRPNFIKHAALSKEVNEKHRDIIVHTGQHYDYSMNEIFFDELGIPKPDYNLIIGSGTYAYQTGEMMKGIENILLKENPDLVIVYGDTNSTIAGALSAAQSHIKVAHVEAGVRCYDKTIPEEINRIITDICSDYLFCPTRTAVDNLKLEGLTKGVYLTGDVMVDALYDYKEKAEQSHILEKLKLTNKQYIIVTVHRPNNTDIQENLTNIVTALVRLAELGETIVFPIHPRTHKTLQNYGLLNKLEEKIIVSEPLGYLDFVKILSHSKKIITDSGGIQKEAYIFNIPCITLMEVSPWVETVDDGWNVLAGSDIDKIIESGLNFTPIHPSSNLFGTGACEKIVEIIGNDK